MNRWLLVGLAAVTVPVVPALQRPDLVGSRAVAEAQQQAAPAAGAKEGTCQLAGIAVPGFGVEQIPAAQFDGLHKAVAPRGDAERWAQIPWETDLWAAKQRAAREGKPLLMWIMDGHPLGCT